MTLQLLCAGAAQGLVRALEAGFDTPLQGRYGAVGAMKEALLGGTPCDVFVSTAAIVAALVADGLLRADSAAPLGRVRTGVAVRAGDAVPDVSTPDALAAALLAADAVYFPDPERATAGIHFARVLGELGIAETLAPRLRTFPNGATAMRELAAAASPRPIGCTQVSEILYTAGVGLAGALPQRFELATVYSAAVTMQSANVESARRFVALLTGTASLQLRTDGGFET